METGAYMRLRTPKSYFITLPGFCAPVCAFMNGRRRSQEYQERSEANRELHVWEMAKRVVKALHLGVDTVFVLTTPTTTLYLTPFLRKGRNGTNTEHAAQHEGSMNKWQC